MALHKGFFKRNGLNVQILFSGNDQDVYDAILKKKADFAISDPIFSAQNEKVVCSGIVVNRIGIWGLTHNTAINRLKRIEDFVGLRIGSLPKPATTFSLISNLKDSNKRLLKSMKVVEAPIGSQQTLLTSNKADIILELEPMLSLAESYGLKAVLSLADYYQDFAFTGITHLNSLAEDDPEIIEKFMRCINKGLDVCLEDEKSSLKISKIVFSTYSDDILKKAYRRLVKAKVWPSTSAIENSAWENALKLRS